MRPLPAARSPVTAARGLWAFCLSGSEGRRWYVRRLPHPYGLGRRLLQRRHCGPWGRPREDLIRRRLARYRELGLLCTLRDGGDRWGVDSGPGRWRRSTGITYRTPVFPIYKRGHYGGFIGRGFDSWETYRALIRAVCDAEGFHQNYDFRPDGFEPVRRPHGRTPGRAGDSDHDRNGPPGGPGGDGPCQRHGCGSGCRSGRSGLCGARGVFASGGLGRDGGGRCDLGSHPGHRGESPGNGPLSGGCGAPDSGGRPGACLLVFTIWGAWWRRAPTQAPTRCPTGRGAWTNTAF